MSGFDSEQTPTPAELLETKNIYADIQKKFPVDSANAAPIPADQICTRVQQAFPSKKDALIIDSYIFLPTLSEEKQIYGKGIMDYLNPLLPKSHLNIVCDPEKLRYYADMIRLENKIHLMPSPEYKGLVIDRLFAAIEEDTELKEAMLTGKILLADIKDKKDEQPQIVIYPQPGQEAACIVLKKIETLFSDCADQIGAGLTPRGNVPVDGKLTYFSQGSWNVKAKYMQQVRELRFKGVVDQVPELDDTFTHFSDETESPISALAAYKNGSKPLTLEEEVHRIIDKLNNAQGEKRSQQEVTEALDRLRPACAQLWEGRLNRKQEPIPLPDVTLSGGQVSAILQETESTYVIGLVNEDTTPIGTIILTRQSQRGELRTIAANAVRIEEDSHPLLPEMCSEMYYDGFNIYNVFVEDIAEEDALKKSLAINLLDLTILTAQQAHVSRLELGQMNEQAAWVQQSGHTLIEKTKSADGWTDFTLSVTSNE